MVSVKFNRTVCDNKRSTENSKLVKRTYTWFAAIETVFVIILDIQNIARYKFIFSSNESLKSYDKKRSVWLPKVSS